ncbi:YceD family protein [Algiphilus sp.]|uniref:YceD family protein n=1 Tax=Algiphilus sp. TaxID=1872431 RepID=UPI003B52834A
MTKCLRVSIIAPAMGTHSLPERVILDRFCGKQQEVAATLGPKDLPRLAALLKAPEWSVAVQARGERPRFAVHRVVGGAEGFLPLECARCMRIFEWPLHLAFAVVVVQGEEEEARWIEQEDTWRAEDAVLPLLERLEDELLLALPDLPRCEDDACESHAENWKSSGPAPGSHGE